MFGIVTIQDAVVAFHLHMIEMTSVAAHLLSVSLSVEGLKRGEMYSFLATKCRTLL